jgi:alkanesulfonate monooxygenase SsuD/methylene tetrahydromethanopterin reductase-like flavin-dependent oxidoreductase (luciferase family)
VSELSFGAGLVSLQAAPGETPRAVYAGGVQFAREVERMGYDAIWAAEHHLSADGYLPSPLVYLAAAGGATERLRLGTAIAVAPLYRPARLAEDCATLQLLSGGRLVLGLGLGWREEERALHGVSGRPRGAELESMVRELREHWSGGRVTPAPAPPVPVYLSGFVDAAARRAGRLADGFIQARGPRETMRRHVDLMREEAAAAGRDPDAIELVTIVSIHVTEGDAWAEVREAALATAAGYAAMAESEQAPDVVTGVQEDEVRRTYVCGTPDEVTAVLRGLVEACAAAARHHLVVRNWWAGLPLDQTCHSLQLFHERVAPNLAP